MTKKEKLSLLDRLVELFEGRKKPNNWKKVRELLREGYTNPNEDASKTSEIKYKPDDDEYWKKIKTEYYNSVDEGLVDFYNNEVKNEGKANEYTICDMPETLKKYIKDLLDIDTSGYVITMDTFATKHIERRHGANGEADHSMKDVRDVARIGYVIKNIDNVEIAKHGNGVQKFSKQFKDKNGKPSPVINLVKRINGYYVASEAVPDTKKKTIHVTTAYIKKKPSNYVQDANAPYSTSKNVHNDLLDLSTDSLNENKDNVNTTSEKKFKIDSLGNELGNTDIRYKLTEEDINTLNTTEDYDTLKGYINYTIYLHMI